MSNIPTIPITPLSTKTTTTTTNYDKKHKDLTKFEYVIDREILLTAPLSQYIVIRVDGRRFKGFAESEQWYRPIDDRPYKLMNRVAAEVMKIYDGQIMFASGQSDEMSFFLQLDTQLYQRRVDKILTTIVSTFTSYYISLYNEYINPTLSPFDINLHQIGPSFYSNIEPTIHPCQYHIPTLIPTGNLSNPISINYTQINESNDNNNTQQQYNEENNHHTTQQINNNINHHWCLHYGKPYAQWCPFHHHDDPTNNNNDNTISHHNSTSSQQQSHPKLQSQPISIHSMKTKKSKYKHLPVFDGKIILLHSEQEVYDYLSWRQVDTHINNQYNTLFYLLTSPPSLPQTIQQQQQQLQQQQYPLMPNKVLTPCEAESIINGTNSTEKILLIQKLLQCDYFSLPTSYKRNSLLFWSDYLPASIHQQQYDLFQLPNNNNNTTSNINTNANDSLTTRSILQDSYWNKYKSSNIDYLQHQFKQLTTFISLTQNFIHHFQYIFPNMTNVLLNQPSNPDQQNQLSPESIQLQQLFLNFIHKLTFWFYHTQNRNITFPSILYDISLSIQQAISFDIILLTNLLSQLNIIQLAIENEIQSLAAQSKSTLISTSHPTTNNNQDKKVLINIPSPQFTLPTLSLLMSTVQKSLINSNDDDIDDNNNGDNEPTDLHSNPALARHIVVYHGDLIQSPLSTLINNNSNEKKNQSKLNQQYQSHENQDPEQSTSFLTLSQLSTQLQQSFPIPYTPTHFWSTHNGLFPHLSTRQRQLQLKKDLKKIRKQQHVENRRLVREKLNQLSTTKRIALDERLGNDIKPNLLTVKINKINQNDNDINNINGTNTNINQQSISDAVIIDQTKHLESNPNWAKKRLQLERYYSTFNIDTTIEATSVAIIDAVTSTTNNNNINSNNNNNCEDNDNSQMNSTNQLATTTAQMILLKHELKNSTSHQINPILLTTLFDLVNQTYLQCQSHYSQIQSNWLSHEQQITICNFLLSNWSLNQSQSQSASSISK